MATQLLADPSAAEKKRGWIATLERSLEQARADLAVLEFPQEPTEEGSVIRFKKYNRAYTFAAVRIGVHWYVTQDGSRSSRQGHAPKLWEELLEWIGERNWGSIELLS